MFKGKKKFPWIDALLVIVILAILTAIILTTINPTVSQNHDEQRASDVKLVLDAVYDYAMDNRGALPKTITTIETVMGSEEGEINICSDLVPDYLDAMPYDPTATDAHYTSCAAYNTGYTIMKDESDHVTVTAVNTELSEIISVTR